METNHTPGPWKFEYGNSDSSGGGCWYQINAADGDELLWFPYNGPRSGGERQEANARLMAAAPDMLNVLLSLFDHGYTTVADHDRVRAVIAKATGAENFGNDG